MEGCEERVREEGVSGVDQRTSRLVETVSVQSKWEREGV
jgi:hypothetical protein